MSKKNKSGNKKKKKAKSKPKAWIMAYRGDFNALVDKIWIKADGMFGPGELVAFAEAAGLAYGTVYNLYHHITKFPLYRTVWKLATAVGWNLEVGVMKKARVRRVA